MAQQESQQEPTMEEILASIRRIISEDEEEPGKAEAEPAEPEAVEEVAAAPEPEPESEPEPEPEPEPAPEPEPEPAPEPEPVMEEPQEEAQVLELTQKVNDDGSVSEVADEAAFDEPVQADDLVVVEEDQTVTDSNLLSDEAAGAAAAAFGSLSRNLTVSVGAGRTIEELVQEMLAPMLKSWLDEHLPGIVDERVKEEIERVARRGR